MLAIVWSSKFKKDYKACMKRQYDIELLKAAVDILQIPNPLPAQYLDHPLHGNYVKYRECHLTPDWLLIYRQSETELFLYRTGTHSDLYYTH